MTRLDETIMEEMEYATFVNIISNIPSCIFYKDKDLKYRFSSHCWNQLISDEIIGKTDADIRKDKENAIKAMEADMDIIKSKKGTRYTIKSEIDGEVSYLELIKEPIIDNGEVIGIVGLINDVTDKIEMQRQIVEMTKTLELQCENLEASNVELKTTLEKIQKLYSATKLFTASMNHELRSPLNGIIGVLQLLLDGDDLNAHQRESLSYAYQSSQLMLGIVNELLDLAKMETNEFRIKNEPFVLTDLVNSISFMAENQARTKNLRFEANIQPGIEDRYVSDATRIKQIINNLVSNSIKYTSSGKVSLNVAYADGNLIVSSADTGQGMSEESIKVLFDPYVRFSEEKNTGIQGTGLGMAIVKKIIDKMNGQIEVESAINIGTRVSFTIPVEIYDEKKYSTINENSDDFEDCNFDFSNIKALCVDDTKVNAIIMKSLLEQIGMKSDIAFSGAEALEKTDEDTYDVIFMDHMMPEMDGLETMSSIRKNSSLNKSTPVVMLTGNAEEQYTEQYRKAGAAGHLIKPVFKESIISVTKSALKNK